MVTVLQGPQPTLSPFPGACFKLWFPLQLSSGWSRRHLCRKHGPGREDALVCTTEGMAPSSPGLRGFLQHQTCCCGVAKWQPAVRNRGWAGISCLCSKPSLKRDHKALPANAAHWEPGEALVAGPVWAQPGEQWAAAHPRVPAKCGSHTHQNFWLPALCCGLLCQMPGDKGIDNLPGMMEPGQLWGN